MSAVQHPVNLSTIGGRLKSERNRLGLSQPAMAALAGATKSAQVKWEKDTAAPNALALAAFAEAGADVLFIVTGWHMATMPTARNVVSLTISEAFLLLNPAERRRLLLDLLAGELAA